VNIKIHKNVHNLYRKGKLILQICVNSTPPFKVRQQNQFLKLKKSQIKLIFL